MPFDKFHCLACLTANVPTTLGVNKLTTNTLTVWVCADVKLSHCLISDLCRKSTSFCYKVVKWNLLSVFPFQFFFQQYPHQKSGPSWKMYQSYRFILPVQLFYLCFYLLFRRVQLIIPWRNQNRIHPQLCQKMFIYWFLKSGSQHSIVSFCAPRLFMKPGIF